MSFITSLLALDIDGFPQSADGMKVQGVSWSRYVYGYICKFALPIYRDDLLIVAVGPAAGFFIAVYFTTMKLESTKLNLWKIADTLANLSLGIYAWVLNSVSGTITKLASKASTPELGQATPLEANSAGPVDAPAQSNKPPNATSLSKQLHVSRRNSALPGSRQRVTDEENPLHTSMNDR